MRSFFFTRPACDNTSGENIQFCRLPISVGENRVIERAVYRIPVIISRMDCPTARILFENYARAAVDHFEAADKLSNLVGQHGEFEEQKEYAKQVHEKCSSARLALEEHWVQHGCREGIAAGL
jgi:hypothetical protein